MLVAPREEHFTSRLRSPAVAARIGLWLGVCFGTAFVTGLISHWAQAGTGWWIPFPTTPSWGYRVTQGLHVTTGTAAIPLLLVKLWTVFPKLFSPIRSLRKRAGLLDLLEKGSNAALVASGVFLLGSGLANSAQWYPWDFSFRSTHYAIAWVAIGSLAVHIGVKLPVIRRSLGSPLEDDSLDRPSTSRTSAGLSRRGLLRTTWLSVGVAVLATAGSTVPALRRVSVLGVRDGQGPQGLPINTTAAEAGATDGALDPDYALTVTYGATSRQLALADLAAMPQVTRELPIACVEGWSASATWTGVPVRDLLDLVSAPDGSDTVVRSTQTRGPYGTTLLQGVFTDDPDTLLALRVNGEELSLDHGFPCRIIAPNRPGVLQTKWVSSLEVTA